MASVQELKRSLADLKSSLAQENILSEDFDQLYEDGYDFALDMIIFFHSEAEETLAELTVRLDRDVVNYHMLEMAVHQLKDNSLSIGATRLVNACLTMSNYCDAANRHGCVVALDRIKEEYALLASKMESIQKLEREILAAGGSI